MNGDKYIKELELRICLLKSKINVLDKKKASYKGMTIVEFETRKSQLPFEVKDFNRNNSRELTKVHSIEGYHEVKARKVFPIPGLTASFCYDYSKNEWSSYGLMHLIWGWEDKCKGNFEDLLKLVIKRDKQRFQDLIFNSIYKESHVITEPISLKNGNQIIEEYTYLYHGGDYEKKSPILLQGRTTLIGINTR